MIGKLQERTEEKMPANISNVQDRSKIRSQQLETAECLLVMAARDRHERRCGVTVQGAYLTALEGAKSAAGLPLPCLPALVRDRIAEALDPETKSSLIGVWGGRLSSCARQEMLNGAAKSYGFVSSAPDHDWQGHLNILASCAYMPSALYSSADIMLAGTLLGTLRPEKAVMRLPYHREVAMRAAERSPWVLKHIGSTLRKDRALFMHVVDHHGQALHYACEALRHDRELCLRAVKQTGALLSSCCAAFQRDRDVVTCAVTQDGSALKWAEHALRDDRQVVMSAVQQNGMALAYASEALRGDAEVVACAVGQNGLALEFASPSMRGSCEVVRRAAEQNNLALWYAGGTL